MATVGIFDSGVGGLTILREVRRMLPGVDFVYYGDTLHVPYGPRTPEEIIELSRLAVDTLLRYPLDAIIIACNTATSIALETLRNKYPKVPMIGVVPVVKTLAEKTTTKRVAVCATAATLGSAMYKKLKEDFARGIDILELAQPDWVLFVETADFSSQEVQASVHQTVKKIKDYGADALALGSTHFPFLRPLLEKALPGVIIIDSGLAVARQTKRILEANNLSLAKVSGSVHFLCSGDPKAFSWVAGHLLGEEVKAVTPT